MLSMQRLHQLKNISANCIDKIEVRDNGHGIAPEDFDALGRRGHTSKISCFEDLETVGRHSLGFRGEALASATILGNVEVTTKRDGDVVASALKLNRGGGLASQSRCSHPVGTTVNINNLFDKIPVRREQWKKEKESFKQVTKIKELLQSYALARVQVRLRLKVLKSPKPSWTFAPRPQDGIKEVVSQLLGRELAAQCICCLCNLLDIFLPSTAGL